VKDCEWIADLLRHGLLKPSFVPDRPQRELRELTRYRTTLVRERSAEVNRLQKTLEGANIKLAAVASNIIGRSGREVLDALVAGSAGPAALAQLARGRLREKLPQLEQALQGRFAGHQRFLVAQQLAHIDYLDEAIERVSAEIEERLRPLADDLARLETIPGVGRRGAEILLAEIGRDMSRFPSAAQLAAWAGMAPGNHESAGKRLSSKTTKGSRWLRGVLTEVAWANARSGNYFGAQFRRLARRRGALRALVAVAHRIIVVIYHVLRDRQPYTELGAQYFDTLDTSQAEKHHVKRLNALGYSVTLTPLLPAEPVSA
jgi:transposase